MSRKHPLTTRTNHTVAFRHNRSDAARTDVRSFGLVAVLPNTYDFGPVAKEYPADHLRLATNRRLPTRSPCDERPSGNLPALRHTSKDHTDRAPCRGVCRRESPRAPRLENALCATHPALPWDWGILENSTRTSRSPCSSPRDKNPFPDKSSCHKAISFREMSSPQREPPRGWLRCGGIADSRNSTMGESRGDR